MSDTMTFLFTDVVGSTRLWESAAPEMAAAMARHDELIGQAVTRNGGREIRPRGEGDSRFCVFDKASDALVAAAVLHRSLADEPWTTPTPIRVRTAVHTGEAVWREGDLYGSAVNRAARLRSLANPDQVLVSSTSARQAGPHLPAPIGLVDLGWHRLKDLAEPERVFQLTHPVLPSGFPSLASPGARSDNLPAAASSFVGRAAELAEIAERLSAQRLVTIVGPGGAGKTRLALEAATAARSRFRDGIWLAELASASDPAAVAAAIGGAVGVELTPGSEPSAMIIKGIAERELLLVIDNAEQVIDDVASLVSEVMAHAPAVRMLVTSREPLAVSAESVLTLAPLAVPSAADALDAEQATAFPAVQLLLERAARARAGFELDDDDVAAVCEICRRVDGIPLALELAAARLRTMGPRDLAARLAERLDVLGRRRVGTGPAHHETLTAAIDWSWQLLDERERTLLAWLTGFAGSFSAEAVEQVCSAADDDTISRLLGLVDRSLVQVVDGDERAARYRLLDTIRVFASERLDAGSAARRDVALVQWAVDATEKAAVRFRGPEQADAFDTLETEHVNLLAALDVADVAADSDSFGRLCAALWWFWARRGHTREADRRLARAREFALDREVATSVLLGSGYLAYLVGATGEDLLMQAAAACEDIGDAGGAAFARSVLANLYTLSSRAPRARALAERSVVDARRAEEPWVLATALRNLGYCLWWEGAYAEASVALEQAIAAAENAGDDRQLAVVLEIVALVEVSEGRTVDAIAHLEQSATILRGIGDQRMVVQIQADLGGALCTAGRLEDAAAVLVDAIAAAADLDGESEGSGCHAQLAIVRHRQGQPSAAREELAIAASAALRVDDVGVLGTCLQLGAALAAEADDPGRAVALLAKLHTLTAETGPVPTPADRANREALLDAARAALDPSAFDAAWSQGCALEAAAAARLAG